MKWIHSQAQEYEGKLYDLDYFLSFSFPVQKYVHHYLLDYRRKFGEKFSFDKINIIRWTLFAVSVDMVCNIIRIIVECVAGNLSGAQNVGAVFSMEIYFTIRGMSLVPSRHKLADVLNKLDEIFPKNREKQQKMRVPELAKYIEKRFCYLHGYTGLTVGIFVIMPIISYVFFFDGSGPIPDDYVQNPSWLPFGIKHNPKYYYFAYIWSTYLSFAGVFHALTHDLIFAVVLTQLVMHFEYLATCVEELNAVETLQAEKSKEFWRKYIDCLKYQQTLKSLSEDANNLFNTSIFFADAVCSFSICFQAYLVTNTDDLFLIATFGTPTFVMTWSSFDFSNRGEDLKIASSKVKDAFYHSNWYEGSLYYQKQIMMCLQCTSQPCKLTALQTIDVNMELFRKMMSLAYQMFAFLQSR